MSDALKDMDALLDIAVDKYAETMGGRIIAGLAKDPIVSRRNLSRVLLAAALQSTNAGARAYLEEQSPGSGKDPDSGPGPAVVPPTEARPKFIRPNGDPYYARKWGKFWDVEVLQKGRETGQFILLIGPPGTGKTAMAEAAFGEDLLTIVITGETRVGELVGGFIPDGKDGWRWIDGPLLTAVREGRPILIDEILLADPKVLSVLYPLMDGRDFLDVTENPEIGVINAEPGFYIIGAGNPNVPGARMSEALVSRFPVHVEVTTDWELLESLGIDDTLTTFASSLAARQASGTISWAPQFREILAFQKTEQTWGREFAVKNLMRKVPPADWDEVQPLAVTTFTARSVVRATI